MTKPNHHGEAGSVFFYILIAIALIAALSFTLSRGSNVSTSSLTKHQSQLAAQEIIEYGNDVAAAVQKLRLRGCRDTEISFDNPIVSGYVNNNAPDDKSCHVYEPAGGALNWKTFERNYFNPDDSAITAFGVIGITGHASVAETGEDCTDNSCNDLVLMLSMVKGDICDEINSKLSLNTASITEGIANVLPHSAVYFKGTYDYAANRIIGDSETQLTGQNSGCMQRGATSGETFYQVLIAR